jgi:uncharacterized protein YcbK (DUF882 family)
MPDQSGHSSLLSRRRFIGAVLASPFALQHGLAHANIARKKPRELSFFHTHTGKEWSLAYHDGMHLVPDKMKQLNLFLSDFRTGDVYPIDTGLLDILYYLKQKTGSRGTFEVISGYRSPKTNEQLRGKSSGVAKRSLHMLGKAIDVRLTDVDTRELRELAIDLGRGGVGYYRKSDFLHLDTGRVRHW